MTVLTVTNSLPYRQELKPFKPLTVTVKANNCDLEMEVDTGASLSIISEATYQSLWAAESKPPLKPTDVKLHTYTKESLHVLLGEAKGVTAKMHVSNNTKPYFAGHNLFLMH